MKNWLIAIGAVIALAAILFLSDRNGPTPSGVPLVRSPDQLVEVNNKAAMLAFGIFQNADNGLKVSDDDKAKLREALKLFEAMRLYDPTRVQSNLGAGKCYMILGEKEKAAERFEQAIVNKNVDPDHDKPNHKLTVYECMALLSEVSVDLGVEEIANYNSLSQAHDTAGAEIAKKHAEMYLGKALDYSNQAVLAVPEATRYLIGRANVLLVMKRDEDAKKDVAKAKALAPTDPRVLMMAKLVGL
jgi:tetratricopeptide (TPR) repeat protein